MLFSCSGRRSFPILDGSSQETSNCVWQVGSPVDLHRLLPALWRAVIFVWNTVSLVRRYSPKRNQPPECPCFDLVTAAIQRFAHDSPQKWGSQIFRPRCRLGKSRKMTGKGLCPWSSAYRWSTWDPCHYRPSIGSSRYQCRLSIPNMSEEHSAKTNIRKLHRERPQQYSWTHSWISLRAQDSKTCFWPKNRCTEIDIRPQKPILLCRLLPRLS